MHIPTILVRPSVAFLAILAHGCISSTAPPVLLRLTAYGIIESERVVMRADETSSVGAKRADATAMRISTSTDRIPLRPGISYGVAFRVIEAPSPEVRLNAVVRTSSPCVLKSTGEVVHHNDSVLTVRVGQLRHLGARIPASGSENHCRGDPRPGTDTFELWFEGRKLAEKTFEVYRE